MDRILILAAASDLIAAATVPGRSSTEMISCLAFAMGPPIRLIGHFSQSFDRPLLLTLMFSDFPADSLAKLIGHLSLTARHYDTASTDLLSIEGRVENRRRMAGPAA